jgi:glycosidase
LHTFYQTLFRLKKSHPALATVAAVEILAADESQRVLAFKRVASGKEVVVVLNFSADERSVDLTGKVNGRYTNVFNQSEILFSTEPAVLLQPWSFSVFAS